MRAWTAKDPISTSHFEESHLPLVLSSHFVPAVRKKTCNIPCSHVLSISDWSTLQAVFNTLFPALISLAVACIVQHVLPSSVFFFGCVHFSALVSLHSLQLAAFYRPKAFCSRCHHQGHRSGGLQLTAGGALS